MVVNFRTHEISQDTHKLTRKTMLIKKIRYTRQKIYRAPDIPRRQLSL
jgi:hypothetical protein